MLTVKYLPWLVEKWRDQRQSLSFVTLVVFLIVAFLFRMNTKQLSTAFVGLIFAVGYLAVVLMSPNIALTKWILLGLTSLNVLVYCNYAANTQRFPGKLNGYTNAHIVQNDYYAYKSRAIADQIKQDGEWARYELGVGNYRPELNNALIRGTSSTNFYFSLSNANVFNFNKSIANNIVSDFEYYGLDNRAELDLLQNVKYYALLKGENTRTIPSGFTQYKRVSVDHKTVYLYRNKNWVPFGYTYDQYVKASGDTDANQLMATMPKAAVTDDNLTGISKASTTSSGFTKLPAKVIATDGVKVQGTQYIVTKPNGSVNFSISVPEKQQLFAELEGIDFGNPNPGHFGATKTGSNLTWQYGNLTKTFDYRNTHQSWYAGITNSVLNMGNGQSGQSIRLTFSQTGMFNFKSVSFYARDYSKLKDAAQHLSQDHLRQVKFEANQVSGNIDLKKTKLLVMTIPYGQGWTAYDNGHKVAIHKINLMSSGIVLPAGKHQIEMRYHTPGLRVGIIISVIAWIVFGLVAFLLHHRRKVQQSMGN